MDMSKRSNQNLIEARMDTDYKQSDLCSNVQKAQTDQSSINSSVEEIIKMEQQLS
jgi:hypothetical protein